MQHGAELRRCLVELDVAGIRKLWAFVSPGMPQPATDAEALHTMHLARVDMETLPAALREYSRAWLAERMTGVMAYAVGISVKSLSGNIGRAADVREAMSDAVLSSIKAGVSLETESNEVRRRMMLARAKVV